NKSALCKRLICQMKCMTSACTLAGCITQQMRRASTPHQVLDPFWRLCSGSRTIMQICSCGTCMRLMFLTPFPPRLDGAHGGARAIAELLVRLAPRHSLGVLYLRTKEESPIDEVLQKQCEWTEEIIRPNERERGMFQMWRALVGRQPVWVNDWCVPAYAERVRQRAQTWQPEIVQIEFHIMGQYVAALRDCPAPRVLVEHEPGVAAAHESYDFKQVRGRIVPYLDVLAWEQYERAILKQVDSVVVFTPQDRQA